MVVIGKASKRIAYELHISVKTVEKHRENVMKKTRAENVAYLVRIVLCPETTLPRVPAPDRP